MRRRPPQRRPACLLFSAETPIEDELRQGGREVGAAPVNPTESQCAAVDGHHPAGRTAIDGSKGGDGKRGVERRRKGRRSAAGTNQPIRMHPPAPVPISAPGARQLAGPQGGRGRHKDECPLRGAPASKGMTATRKAQRRRAPAAASSLGQGPGDDGTK